MSKPTKFMAQKAAIATTTAKRYVEQRPQAQAVALTRGARALASSELCNEAILRFIGLCYEHDPILDGPANVEGETGRILISVPWGRLHHRYSLQSSEAHVLRRHMMALQGSSMFRHIPPLFVYAPEYKRWLLNTFHYQTKQDALDYWRKVELTAKTYARIADALRKQRRRND